MKQNKILIIGSIPPPIGGVTVHVQRLLGLLTQQGIPYTFFDYKRSSLFKLPVYIWKHNIIHCHICNVFVCFSLALLTRMFGKMFILTRHGNIKKRSKLSYCFWLLTLKITTFPILLNKNSFDIALKMNKTAVLMSAFIPPITINPLPPPVIQMIEQARMKYKYLFCSNAYNIAFDSDGNEIYGITELLEVFRKLPQYFLFVAACNQNYTNYLQEKNIVIPDNVYMIQIPIDYMCLLQNVDGSIRNTITDGDALSIREALFLHRNVFATDCVSRPEGTLIYHNSSELLEKLENFSPDFNSAAVEDTTIPVIDFFKKILALKNSGNIGC